MTGKLRLGPLPNTEMIRLTIALPAAVKADLDRYAELYRAASGEGVNAAALAPHMLAALMERDRGFRSSRQAADASKPGVPQSASTSAATSSTSEIAGDDSSR